MFLSCLACPNGPIPAGIRLTLISTLQDREAEPRFTGPPSRGDYGGGPGRGGFGGGFGGGYGGGGGATGGGGRQIYVSNVCSQAFPSLSSLEYLKLILLL